MNLLIDENLPRSINKHLVDYNPHTAQEMGWRGKKNGELLNSAVGQFDVLLTLDKSLPKQQNLAEIAISIVTLRAMSNKIVDLLPLMRKLKEALDTIDVAVVLRVTQDGIEQI